MRKQLGRLKGRESKKTGRTFNQGYRRLGRRVSSSKVVQRKIQPETLRGVLKPKLPIKGVPHLIGIGFALVPLMNTGVNPGIPHLRLSVSMLPAVGDLSGAHSWCLPAQMHLVPQQIKTREVTQFTQSHTADE